MQPSNSLPASSSNPNAMVGFEDELLEIKKQLVGSSVKREIISIVGMGGIGKTTLAINIYNDSFIKHHFDNKAWTTVSQEYNVKGLLENLLESMGKPPNEIIGKDVDELKQKLYQSLKQQRYLIVMDDVWDSKVLEEFRRIFPDDNNGSRIIMTTRSSQVGNSSCYIHHLNFLNPEQSWTLLRQKAFGEECCPPELEDVGKRIAEKCKGLALALVVIGGILYKAEKTQAYWVYVARNVKSEVTRNYDDLMEILSWSYKHLPHRLRACFLYMGVFPEDYEVRISHIIKLWVAEGFLKPIASKSLEQVGKECLEDLIDRNLIMVRQRSYTGKIKTCSIHDLMRKLCMRKAQEEMFLQVPPQSGRYLSIQGEMWNYSRSNINARSLLYFRDCVLPYHHHHHKYTSFQLLRVLDACKISFEKFPNELVKLVNLRYIALVYEGEDKIPASISKLCNLQTLIVFRRKRFERILYLPSEIFKMPRLRHLLFNGALCSKMLQGTSCGERNGIIQTLSGVMNFTFTNEVLGMFPNLKKLEISYNCDLPTALSSYRLENLVHLHQLEKLECRFNERFRGLLSRNLAPSFPQKLNKLTLTDCRISWKHMSAIGSLPNLQVLKLIYFDLEKNTWETKEGEFHQLKFLFIQTESKLFWNPNFPILECLSLRGCRRLKFIPSRIGETQTLKVIVLSACPLSLVDSANKIQKEQEELGNDSLQVHVYSEYVISRSFSYYMMGR